MNRLKVTDGDIIVVTFAKDQSYSEVSHFGDMISKWLKSRGLNDVQVMLGRGHEAFSITVLSVNDVFDNTVLKNE